VVRARGPGRERVEAALLRSLRQVPNVALALGAEETPPSRLNAAALARRYGRLLEVDQVLVASVQKRTPKRVVLRLTLLDEDGEALRRMDWTVPRAAFRTPDPASPPAASRRTPKATAPAQPQAPSVPLVSTGLLASAAALSVAVVPAAALVGAVGVAAGMGSLLAAQEAHPAYALGPLMVFVPAQLALVALGAGAAVALASAAWGAAALASGRKADLLKVLLATGLPLGVGAVSALALHGGIMVAGFGAAVVTGAAVATYLQAGGAWGLQAELQGTRAGAVVFMGAWAVAQGALAVVLVGSLLAAWGLGAWAAGSTSSARNPELTAFQLLPGE
jgi:hypothetical protein